MSFANTIAEFFEPLDTTNTVIGGIRDATVRAAEALGVPQNVTSQLARANIAATLALELTEVLRANNEGDEIDTVVQLTGLTAAVSVAVLVGLASSPFTFTSVGAIAGVVAGTAFAGFFRNYYRKSSTEFS